MRQGGGLPAFRLADLERSSLDRCDVSLNGVRRETIKDFYGQLTMGSITWLIFQDCTKCFQLLHRLGEQVDQECTVLLNAPNIH